jgi:2-polyprenyl-6-methoxyphenol hydroxylase-like FAD-dependent oxidoreductase
MANVGRHAIVIGGSMAGLAAARVLAERFERVTVLERDALDGEGAPRKGVPQGRHVHSLYSTGLAVLEDLFPGLGRDLLAAGSTRADLGADIRWWHWGGWRTVATVGRDMLFQTRPMLEGHVRRRLRAVPNVTIRGDADVARLIGERGARVTGVALRARRDGAAEETIAGDLVVDATGRGSRAPRWVEDLGFAAPRVTELRIDLAYASRVFRRRGDELGGVAAMAISPAGPAERRIGVIFPVEGDRYLVSLGGWVGDHPPTDEAGWLAFARALPTPELHDVLRRLEPIGEIAPYRVAANLRRHWEKLARVPEGFVVVGDAVASFNPAYGQGMTVAALEAIDLRTALASGLEGLPRRFFRRAARTVTRAWTLAAGEDLRFPEVTGPRPLGARAVNAYVAACHRATHRDPDVLRAMYSVFELQRRPEVLVAPGMLARVWRAQPAER